MWLAQPLAKPKVKKARVRAMHLLIVEDDIDLGPALLALLLLVAGVRAGREAAPAWRAVSLRP